MTSKKGYLAGFIDGEGHITISKFKSRKTIELSPRVAVYNTNLEVLLWLQQFFEGATIIKKRSKDPKHKDEYRLELRSQKNCSISQTSNSFSSSKETTSRVSSEVL